MNCKHNKACLEIFSKVTFVWSASANFFPFGISK